jgi:hypothetical protein
MGAINLIQRGYSEMYHYISQLFFMVAMYASFYTSYTTLYRNYFRLQSMQCSTLTNHDALRQNEVC